MKIGDFWPKMGRNRGKSEIFGKKWAKLRKIGDFLPKMGKHRGNRKFLSTMGKIEKNQEFLTKNGQKSGNREFLAKIGKNRGKLGIFGPKWAKINEKSGIFGQNRKYFKNYLILFIIISFK